MLTLKDLAVKFPSRFGDVTAIEDVDMTIRPGEIHGLVGESGAGKSPVGAAVIGLISTPGYIARGEITLGDTDLRALTPEQAHAVRGDRISMIFQDPQTSLNPLLTVEGDAKALDLLSDIDPDGLRPREALDLLYQLKSAL